MTYEQHTIGSNGAKGKTATNGHAPAGAPMPQPAS
jgi:hypothetical protein